VDTLEYEFDAITGGHLYAIAWPLNLFAFGAVPSGEKWMETSILRGMTGNVPGGKFNITFLVGESIMINLQVSAMSYSRRSIHKHSTKEDFEQSYQKRQITIPRIKTL
jgi:hypothetical protein